MPRSAHKFFLASLFFGLFFYSAKASFAETTPYKSASIVTTDTIISSLITPYENTDNCSATDGLTCDRPSAPYTGNLYFRNFGDFGIPAGAVITAIRIRVTGKSSIPLYAGGFRGSVGCQTPSDKWTMYSLVGSTIQTYEVRSINDVDFTYCFTAASIRANDFIFRINRAGPTAWSANIDNLELGFEYSPIAPTPSPSPSPTPTPPPPFLDLPWDYEEGGLSFTEAALNINSFFDHTYPLLSAPTLTEDNINLNQVTTYENENSTTKSYSKHDGYDYGSRAGAGFGDPVLAAAGGTATFVNTCGACGKAIHIDHGNGYQTRYYHLQEDGLITNIPGQEIEVNKTDPIGKVGDTGNCYSIDANGNRIYNTPSCGHIHFMVVENKNGDRDFEDNIPDGITDPFGWQSEDPDPWENYPFFYKGQDRTGNKSFYLWTKQINNLNANLTANGGVFNSGRNSVTVPAGATNQNLLLKIISTPIQKLSDLISSIGTSVQITAEDESGNQVTSFDQPVTVGISFEDFDLTRFLTDTLSIYSSSDGIDWIKEDTNVDLENKTATAEVDHLTYFALMAERKDTQAATTFAILLGDEGEDGHFHSDVSVSLEAVDNEGGLGVDYILFRKGDEDWQEYISPIQFSNEGEYSIEFYSVDNDENIEELKTVIFAIDKTPPEAEIYYSLPNKNIQFDGKDSSGSASVTLENIARNKKIVVTDEAGNTLTAVGSVFNSKNLSWLSIDSLQYNNLPSVKQDRNNFLTVPLYDRNTNQLKSITQIYSVKDKNIIGIVYSVVTDKTKVYTYDRKNKQIFKEELAGMHLLKLTTENGSLKYSY